MKLKLLNELTGCGGLAIPMIPLGGKPLTLGMQRRRVEPKKKKKYIPEFKSSVMKQAKDFPANVPPNTDESLPTPNKVVSGGVLKYKKKIQRVQP